MKGRGGKGGGEVKELMWELGVRGGKGRGGRWGGEESGEVKELMLELGVGVQLSSLTSGGRTQ